jgi:hypothetical protein
MTTTTFNQAVTANYNKKISGTPLFTKFMDWCENQQESRFLWLGIALAGHGCILTPITVMAVLFAGANLALFILALVAMSLALVTNLAALPTKITIPVFVFSILLDLGIVIACAVAGFNPASTF